MKILFVRHARAEERSDFAHQNKPDPMRPLTEQGQKQFALAAQTLAMVCPEAALLVSSPFKRALQTAEILADQLGLRIMESPALEPECEPAEFWDWINRHGPTGLVVAVGHEPHLSRMISWLVTGDDRSFVVMKKGGACLVEGLPKSKPGQFKLCWLMTGKQLRRGKRAHSQP